VRITFLFTAKVLSASFSIAHNMNIDECLILAGPNDCNEL